MWYDILKYYGFKNRVFMKREEILKNLIEKTFANIACPLNGNGLYAELQKAITEAYSIGQLETQPQPVMVEISSK